jgi:hypothetical protein
VRALRPIEHRDGPVLHADRHGTLEQATDLVRRRGGRQIEIVVLEVQEVVADRAAHAPGLEPRLFERPRDAQHLIGDGEPVRELHALRGRSQPHNTLPPLTFTISPVM